ncbi:hypothetical protein D3C76_1255700 [compost metagenome]
MFNEHLVIDTVVDVFFVLVRNHFAHDDNLAFWCWLAVGVLCSFNGSAVVQLFLSTGNANQALAQVVPLLFADATVLHERTNDIASSVQGVFKPL